MIDLRDRLIAHIMHMRKHDPDYARSALVWYAELLPWLKLNSGVKAAMENAC